MGRKNFAYPLHLKEREREFVCVFKEGVLIGTGEGAGDSEILI